MSVSPDVEEPGPEVASPEEVGKPLQEGVVLDVGDPEWMTIEEDSQAAFDAMWADAETP